MPTPAEELLRTYRPLHGLPSLAGITSFELAQQPGLSIEESVSRLLRFHHVLKRLMESFTFRVPEEPIYELKMAFSMHAHYCAEQATAIRERVAEMRQPPLGLDKIPDPHLETLLLELRYAPTASEFVAGTYGVLLPALQRGVDRYLEQANPLADHPTCRQLRFAQLDLTEMLNYGEATQQALSERIENEVSSDWLTLLQQLLTATGDLDGTQPREAFTGAPVYSEQPRPIQKVPQRDERFADPYNMGVHAEEFLYSEEFDPRDKTLMMYFKRLREIDVPEMMATIIHETDGQPWAYYRDMTRQLWDEARHAMMGEVGFVSLGINWPEFLQVNHTWALGLNTQLAPWERHAVLFYIEQGLMTRTGKRYEWEVGTASGDTLSRTFQDYDWADEVLHARIGRDWYVSQFKDLNEALAYGDACWSKVLMNWSAWKEQGLTEHTNWWPGLYQQFCTVQNREPDPAALAYHVTYETSRADLEKLSVSG